MAELTEPGVGREDETPPASGSTTDPRAVRIQLAATSALGDEPAMLIAPAPVPLQMTNPTVGAGPFGGVALSPEPDPPVGVLAQRQLLVDGRPSSVSLRDLGGQRHLLVEDETATRLVLEPETRGDGSARVREVLVDGFRFLVEVESERIASLRERATRGRTTGPHAGPLAVKAIIPGKVVAISVGVGDAVTAGQQLLVVEAMKMQNELRAPRDGTIERLGVTVGVNIEIGDLLVVIS